MLTLAGFYAYTASEGAADLPGRARGLQPFAGVCLRSHTAVDARGHSCAVASTLCETRLRVQSTHVAFVTMLLATSSSLHGPMSQSGWGLVALACGAQTDALRSTTSQGPMV